MFTPGLAIFYSATILRPGHVCGVECHACGIVTWQSELSVGHELCPFVWRARPSPPSRTTKLTKFRPDLGSKFPRRNHHSLRRCRNQNPGKCFAIAANDS